MRSFAVVCATATTITLWFIMIDVMVIRHQVENIANAIASIDKLMYDESHNQ